MSWRVACDAAIRRLIDEGHPFTADDVFDLVDAPARASRSAVGPRLQAAQAANLIHPTGATRTSRRVEAGGRKLKVWAPGPVPVSSSRWALDRVDHLETVCWVTGCGHRTESFRGLKRHLQSAHGLESHNGQRVVLAEKAVVSTGIGPAGDVVVTATGTAVPPPQHRWRRADVVVIDRT